jgi:hypothetical protein
VSRQALSTRCTAESDGRRRRVGLRCGRIRRPSLAAPAGLKTSQSVIWNHYTSENKTLGASRCPWAWCSRVRGVTGCDAVAWTEEEPCRLATRLRGAGDISAFVDRFLLSIAPFTSIGDFCTARSRRIYSRVYSRCTSKSLCLALLRRRPTPCHAATHTPLATPAAAREWQMKRHQETAKHLR